MNKRHHWIIIAFACVFSAWIASSALASEIGQEVAGAVDVASYRHYLDDVLYTHTGDDRGYDGPEHDLARDAIAAEFEALGYEVEIETFYGYQDLGHNVVATKRGRLYPDSYYLIGAHYDSVGNPGADDDASGVAGLLELARVFANYDTGYSLMLVAFDEEETGLRGSRYSAYCRRGDDILGMIQLDMIAWDFGRYRTTIEAANSYGSALANELDVAIDEYGGDLGGIIGSTYGGTSDHRSFGDAGFPACCLIERREYENPCYHLACDSVDEPDYISYEMASDIVRSVAGFLADHLITLHHDDCDQNGISDAQQILIDPELDCNGNGMLDVCEPGGDQDCNANGVPDACDIFAGTSADLDQNAIPDECQPRRYVPAEYETIQAALDAANPGDVVIVADGTYTGPGNIDLDFYGKALLLNSENGPENCFIDCAGDGRGIRFISGESKASAISGFTIMNGFTADKGSAIYCSNSNPTISNCIITTDIAQASTGIYAENARKIQISDCTIISNHSGGGAVRLEECIGRINRCQISGHSGSAIYCSNSKVAIFDCIIENSSYGIMCIYSYEMTIAYCSITSNSGPGIYSYQTEDMQISKCTITDNVNLHVA